jgi:branched-chain amino acid transport system permease protein
VNVLGTLIDGILLGGYYALIATGLSFMFSVMKVINIAHGSLGVLAAFMLATLAQRYDLDPFLGLIAVIPVMAVVGLLLQRGVLERATRGGALIPVLSTFGLSIVIDNLLFQHYGADTRSLAPYIGDLSYDSWELTETIALGKLAIVTFGTAVAMLGGLQAFLTFTPLGRAIRATALDRDTAELVGINSRRINAIAAAIALATVAVAGMFMGMRATFDPYSGPTQLIFAFETTVIGGGGSLWGTLIGGIILGCVQIFGSRIHPQGFLIAGHAVFIVFLISRYLLGTYGARRRPSGAAASPQLPAGVSGATLRERLRPLRIDLKRPFAAETTITRWSVQSKLTVAAFCVLAIGLATAPGFASGHALDRMTTLFVYIILAVMWNAMSGYAGLVSVGQQAFFGLGAYFAVRLSSLGLNAYAALLIAPIGVGLIALPMSSVMLRLKGGELAIGMWVVAELCRLLVNLDPLVQGDTGTSLIALQSYAAEARHAYTYWLGLGGAVLAIGAVFALVRSRLGAATQAIRDSETAAASIGVKVLSAKRAIFLLAAVGTAIAGATWLASTTTFQPRSFFGIQWTAYMIFMVLVGGIGRFEGPILGAVLFFLAESWLGESGVWYLVSIGMFALLASLYLPSGIWGLIEDRFQLRLLPIGYRLNVIQAPDAPSGAKRSATLDVSTS